MADPHAQRTTCTSAPSSRQCIEPCCATCASICQGLLHDLVLDADNPSDDDDLDAGAAPPAWLHAWHSQAAPGDAYLQALWQTATSPEDRVHALHHAYRQAGAQDDISVALLTTDT